MLLHSDQLLDSYMLPLAHVDKIVARLTAHTYKDSATLFPRKWQSITCGAHAWDQNRIQCLDASKSLKFYTASADALQSLAGLSEQVSCCATVQTLESEGYKDKRFVLKLYNGLRKACLDPSLIYIFS